MSDPDASIAEDCGRLSEYPLEWVMYAFPWCTDASIQKVKLQEPYASRFPNCEYGPETWICEILDDWGAHMRRESFDFKTPVNAYQAAVASGHGIGKSAATAWIILFIMSTRPGCKGTATAGTSGQLKTKTWAELGKWHKKAINSHWFKFTNSERNMTIKHVDDPENWRCDAFTCTKENKDSFAGQHAADSTPFYIFDEASAIPDEIWEVAEGGKTDGEPVHFAFGNPTQNSGKFRECFRNNRHRWNTKNVDSRTVQITNKNKLQEFVDDHGEESDFVKVRVRGLFPSQSSLQFISEEDVNAAFGRHLRPEQYNFAPVIITCDPAWTGEDELIIAKRQGLRFDVLHRIPKNDDDMYIAGLIARHEDEFQADAVFIDMGYGTGIYSCGKSLGRTWRLVNFGSKASETPEGDGFYLKRSEMWGGVKSWLKEGGCLPSQCNGRDIEQDIRQDLTGPYTVPRADGKIQLESKKDMKKRGLPSPNIADSLALSFAYPAVKKKRNSIRKTEEYRPF